MPLEKKVQNLRLHSLGWKMQRIVRRLDEAMNARLAEHDLNIQQFAVLMSVLERDGQTQTEIGAQFGMPPYAISRALDHLEKTSRVERRPHPTSRRALTVHATDIGQAKFPTLVEIVEQSNAELTAPLSKYEETIFSDILTRIMANL